VDVRVISSTKYDLKSLIAIGKFRDDLFYRLNVIPIHIPPLRERKSDIPVLAQRFIDEFSQGKPLQLEQQATDILKNYSWPGNVRELRNLMERLVLTCKNNILKVSDIPAEFLLPDPGPVVDDFSDQWDLEAIMTETETRLLRAAISRSSGNKSKAAKLLKIPLSTLRTKLEKYKLD
jgi:transcriptional regulator with PAS, ATPase and Fis domain